MSKRSQGLQNIKAIGATSFQEKSTPDLTSKPEDFESPQTGVNYYRDSTNTWNIVEELPEETPQSVPELIGKILYSGEELPIIPIASLGSIAAIFWIFIQDNSSGVLKPQDWKALLWTLMKCGIILLLIFIWVIICKLFKWFKKK